VGSKNVLNSGTSTINNTFDASAAASFVANVVSVEVAIEPASGVNRVTGILTLPPSASITASTRIAIADNVNQGGTGVINVGSGTTTFTTPILLVGGRKGDGTLNVAPGGTLIVGSPKARTQLGISRNTGGTGVFAVGTFDLSGAGDPRTLVAHLQSVVIGEKTGGSTGTVANATGIWNLGNSPDTKVEILNGSGLALLLGHITPSNAAGQVTPSQPVSGTVTLNTGLLTVSTIDAVLPALRLGAADGAYLADQGGHARGIMNLNGGKQLS
jgi:hypothetical protein